ncbi:ATP-binding protein [Muricoccus radiodurans]|uniref:ATP-binding protein n=1 Tax=Muricoccus radiodurans TaxID=2231721 RepID=UPI003CEA887F
MTALVRRLTRLWPASLAGRVTLLLLGGLTLLHLGSVWVHERALQSAETGTRASRLAERVVAARAAVEALPPEARDRAAHALATPGIDVHWDRVSPVPPGTPTPEGLTPVVAVLGPSALVAWDPKAEPGHRVVGALPVVAGGWIVFSASWLGTAGAPWQGASDLGALLSLLAMAVGIAIASALVVRWITGPLRRLADAADALGRDLRSHPVPADGPSEVRHAAVAFNAMQHRIARLVEDRTEALAAMSHDLRTPLARLRLRAGFLPDGEARERMEADIAEMEGMIGRTLDYLREGRDAEPTRPADLAAIMQTLASDAADAGHDVAYEGPSRAVLPLRPAATKRALSNLLSNALSHGAEPVRLRLRDDGTEVVVEVADAGSGILPADRARAVAPFVQLDPSRGTGGSGLGLAIVSRFAEALGGSLHLDDAPGGGLAARLHLSRKPALTFPRGKVAPERHPSTGGLAMTRIRIPNMTCGGCAKGVAATLRDAVPGAEPAVDLERREVTVAGDPAALVAALRADGWEAEVVPA